MGATTASESVGFDGSFSQSELNSEIEGAQAEFGRETRAYTLTSHFGVRKTDLSAKHRAALDNVAALWVGATDVQVHVVGHSSSVQIAAENRREFADNYVLSRTRAKAVVEYLRRFPHLASARYATEGRGPDQPVGDNATVEGRAANRRVELTISGERPEVTIDRREASEAELLPRLDAFLSFEAGVEGQRVAGNEPEEDDAEASASAFAFLDLQLTESFSIELEASYNTVGDGKNFAFTSQELFVETLMAKIDRDHWGFEAGKVDMIFDIWDQSPGLFGTFQGDDLDLSEVLGSRIWFEFSDHNDGDHFVHVGVFQQDTTVLSGSIITDDGDRSELGDGGLANTEELNNWFVSLNGDSPVEDSDWEYALGLVYQSPGVEEERRELAIFSGVYDSYDLENNVEVSKFLELLYRDGADGEENDALTIALGMGFETNSWSFSASYSSRFLDAEGDMENDFSSVDHNVDLYAGYSFDSGIYLDFGYRYLRESSENEHLLTITIGKPFDISFGRKSTLSESARREDIKRTRRIKRN